MATIFQLEQSIIARLVAELGNSARISELPVDPADIGVPVSGSQIWVAFKDESFEAPGRTGVTSPLRPESLNRTMTFELIIRGQQVQVSGHQQSYDLIDRVRAALTGWMDPAIEKEQGPTRPFYPVRAGFTSFGAGLWVYSATYACTSVYSPRLQKEKFSK